MKRRITIVIIFLACIVLTGLICWIVSAYVTSRLLYTQFASIELSEIALDVRTSSILNGQSVVDNKEFDKILFPKVLTIAIFRPEASRLPFTPLKTLCRLIVYRHHGGFGSIQDSPMKDLVFRYLDSQEVIVAEQLRQPLRHLQKARQNLVAEHVITSDYLKKIESRDHSDVVKSDLCEP